MNRFDEDGQDQSEDGPVWLVAATLAVAVVLFIAALANAVLS